MTKTIITIGISGSGKSTWAYQYALKKRPHETWIVVERDEIRKTVMQYAAKMPFEKDLDWDAWEWEWERRVSMVQEGIFRAAYNSNVDGVIVADTNLSVKGRNDLYKRLVQCGADPQDVYAQLFDVEESVAIDRDSTRKHPVGEDVIRIQLQRLNEDMPFIKALLVNNMQVTHPNMDRMT